MGLIGLAASWLFGIPVCATYHTDLPRYAATLSGDPRLEEASWNVMTWFYGKMARIAAPSPPIRDDLMAHGLSTHRIRIVGRGVDAERFSPRFRDKGLRQSWKGGCTYYAIYVGRVSEEKNLPCLVDAYRRLARTRPDIGLVIAGEGPYLDVMRRELADLPVTFTGFVQGEALSRAYASSDLFVFPSETDTFGNVVLEAQASGLPIISSGKGGPKHCIVDGASGLVLDKIDGPTFAHHIDRVLSDDQRLGQMSAAALLQAQQFTPQRAFEGFWQMQQECVEEWKSGAARVGYDGRLAGLRALAVSRWFE
jgi:glycosyltransferase involved in cell wall biosynthesis